MTLPEAHAIVADHQKWRRAEPPYAYDPDADEMYPACPKTTPAQLGEALDLLLAATAPATQEAGSQTPEVSPPPSAP